MKNFIKNEYFKHFMFIVSIFSLIVAVEGYDNRGLNDDELLAAGFGFIIIFFLWKNNYFTRNKK